MGAGPPHTQAGGSGLSYHVFRGAMTGRYLASWGGEAEKTGHSERGEEGRGVIAGIYQGYTRDIQIVYAWYKLCATNIQETGFSISMAYLINY